jgi:hypothetical protein
VKELCDAIKACYPLLIYSLLMIALNIFMLHLERKRHDNFQREIHEARMQYEEKV